MTKQIIVNGPFDDIRSPHVRLLQEAARLGEVHVLVWPDRIVQSRTGMPPKFPLAERLYFLKALRYVCRATPLVETVEVDSVLPQPLEGETLWVDDERQANAEREAFCRRRSLEYRVFGPAELAGFPEPTVPPPAPGRKKVVVTGCYDWFHSGHVRFFEEVSNHGDLYVIVGHDANIRLLKGAGHPLLPEVERRYMAASVRYVTRALISSGEGWLDADPEIRRLAPDIYAVNEDGDKGGKREYCEKMGIQYLVLKREPAPGLPGRSSTNLRGF
jgi:cytidyltransferase-like protein